MSETEKPKALMTFPEEITAPDTLTLTGNEYVSLPHIDPEGGIRSLNILRLDYRGLLEFSGSTDNPLLAPFLEVEEKPVQLINGDKTSLAWSYQLNWLPSFKMESREGWMFEGMIIAPPNFKGFCYQLRFSNHSDKTVKLKTGWQGFWNGFNYIVFNRHPVEGERRIRHDRWTNSLILDATKGLPLAAMAVAVEPEAGWEINQENSCFQTVQEAKLEPGKTHEVVLYAAVNLEADGAGTTCVDLRRHGYENLQEKTALWLKSRQTNLVDSGLGELLNRNLFFCYFYSLARSLDSEDLVPLTSRSPRYYVSSAYWSRDTLLWSFPAILMADQKTARDLLITVFRHHLKNAGDHAHYINGTLLYPGFEMDQLAAYFLALEHYLGQSGDDSILDEPEIYKGLYTLVDKVFDHFDPDAGLYSTFLDPSDDPVSYPFLTYNNGLLQRSFNFLARLQERELWSHKGDFAILARELLQAIFDHCMVKGPCGTMFAWSVDGKGKFTLYDNPPGSLQLLAHYQFCSLDDTVFKNTVHWIRSTNNRYFFQGTNFEEAGSRHAENPWPLAACNDLLACNAGAVDFFKRAEMDNGFFCESINPKTGLVTTGAAFASAAGFLAYALSKAEKENKCLEANQDIE
ncbi:MAG: glycoside hydrolase family 125 protein [Bacillota bacterium]